MGGITDAQPGPKDARQTCSASKPVSEMEYPETNNTGSHEMAERARVNSELSNKEIEGCMADPAMLTRTALMAIGSYVSIESGPTCTPVLVTG